MESPKVSAFVKVGLLASSCGAALALGSPAIALAQSPAPSSVEVESLVVTGSRIATAGFTAPTPVTVISATDLVQTRPLITEGLNDLPQLTVGGARSAGNGSGGSGQATVSLRSLGSSRTLVLLDGRRFVPQNGGGAVDTSLMPTALVSRVDVVTGGASAAYGSDAVAGVVNFILNTRYSGFKASTLAGISQRGDLPEFKLEAAVGRPFAGDRGHVIASTEYYAIEGISRQDRDVYNLGANLITNPGAGPKNLIVTDARVLAGTRGGLITSGPLRGVTFDPGGIPRQFVYGTLVGSQNQVGGEGEIATGQGVSTIVGTVKRFNTFVRGQLDLTENINVFAENLLSWSYNDNNGGKQYATGNVAIRIQRDNAFLPASIRDRMTSLNLANVTIGRLMTEFPDTLIDTDLFTWRPTVGVDFQLNANWKGEAYYQYGFNRRSNRSVQPDQPNWYLAMDAVVAPANARAGIVPGSIVCRSALTNPNSRCIPMNIFGQNAMSQSSIDAIMGRSWNLSRYEQHVAAVSMSGEPLTLPAGPLSTAFGLEYRKEILDFVSDPYSQIANPVTNAFGGWRSGNQLPFAGEISVREGFLEVAAPLAKDLPLVRTADVNAAVRVTDYSTSGTVTTWKVGLIYEPVEGVRFRGTRSRDIRAPNMSNLFQAGSAGTAALTDPTKNITVSGIRTITRGNPALAPEEADTLVYGVVLQPTFLPGLSLSVDRWDISIDGAIASVDNQTILNQCYADPSSSLCSFIVRDAAGNLTGMDNRPFNFSSLATDGVDIEASYRTEVPDALPVIGSSRANLRFLTTRMNHNTTQAPGGVPTDSAGEAGDNSKWRGLVQLTLAKGAVSGFLQTRFLSGGTYSNQYVEGVDINRNHFDAYNTWDARISYRFQKAGANWTAGLSVNNLLDREPPIIPSNGTSPSATRNAYDVQGRYFRVSLDASF